MKVALVHHGGGIGGAPTSMIQLARALQSQGHEPLLVFSEEGPAVMRARQVGTRTRVAAMPSAFFYSAHVPMRLRMLAPFVVGFGPTVLSFRRVLRQERPDLVHLNTSVLLASAVATRLAGLPLVWQVREVLGPNPVLRALHRTAIEKLADRIIAISAAVQSCFRVQERVHLVPNAVDLSEYPLSLLGERDTIRARLNLPAPAQVVTIVGNVQRVKGHYVLLEAVRRLSVGFPQLRVMVVAAGSPASYANSAKGRVKRLLRMALDNLEALRQEAARLGLADRLLFIGYRDDMPAVMAATDVLVFPSLQAEGFGRPLIEAMAMARPVVACDIGASPEIVEHGESGLLVPPGDAEALTEAIARLLDGPELRELMGKAGRRRVEERFTIETAVEGTLRAYEGALAARGRSGRRGG